MKDILEEIVERKRQEVTRARARRVSMRTALETSQSGIIAEFKRKSPSKGWIQADARIEDVAPAYERAGAAALSILTDETYFGGSRDFLARARALTRLPLLRKDFIIDLYQVYEAKIFGADAVLLIAADLTPARYGELQETAHSIGLETLLEVHDPSELNYLEHGIPDMLGVNNRHLGTFRTDTRQSFRVADTLRSLTAELGENAPLLVSESGISEPETVKELRTAGFRGFLIGERFMREDNPGKALEQFIQKSLTI